MLSCLNSLDSISVKKRRKVKSVFDLVNVFECAPNNSQTANPSEETSNWLKIYFYDTRRLLKQQQEDVMIGDYHPVKNITEELR